MAAFSFVTVDVFTDRRFGGNPLAVFSDARGLSDADMQSLAEEFNLSETTFVLPPENPAHPWTNWITMEILIVLLILVLFAWLRPRLSVDRPGKVQHLFETLFGFIEGQARESVEHNSARFVPFFATLFIFILFMNLLGLIPWMATATSNLAITCGLALCTFVITQVAGMRAQGVVGYWVHLVPSGVPGALWPLMFVIELFGLFTKPFALTVRLFANMVAGHIVIFFLIALTVLISPFIAPVSVAFALGIYMLELFVALVQAYVFTMLSAVFIGMTQHAH